MTKPWFPAEWEYSKLEDVVEILDALRVPVNNTERQAKIEGKNDNELFPYYGATGEVGKIDDYLFDEELVALGEDGVPFFDNLKDKAYLLEGKTWVNNHAHVLRGWANGLDNKLLLNYLNQFDYHDYVNGGTRLKLTQANMRKIPVPLPPLAEQKVIVDKLDTLLAQVQNTKAHLERISTILKTLRQSVLTAAVSGELTKEWRANSSVKWLELNVIDVIHGKPRNGHSPKGVNNETPYRNLTLSATTSGQFIENQYKYVNLSIDSDSYLWVKNGDILIQRANTIDYVGVSAIYEGEDDKYVYPDLMMKCKPNTQRVLGKYLYLALSSEKVRKYFRDNATGTSGNMPKINQQVVSNAPISLPPLEEQTEIVRRVEQLFTFADHIEQKANTALAHVNNLTQSILAKAFRGELTAEWRAANPELISGKNSAEALLAKIKEERKALKSTKPTRGRKKA